MENQSNFETVVSQLLRKQDEQIEQLAKDLASLRQAVQSTFLEAGFKTTRFQHTSRVPNMEVPNPAPDPPEIALIHGHGIGSEKQKLAQALADKRKAGTTETKMLDKAL